MTLLVKFSIIEIMNCKPDVFPLVLVINKLVIFFSNADTATFIGICSHDLCLTWLSFTHKVNARYHFMQC